MKIQKLLKHSNRYFEQKFNFFLFFSSQIFFKDFFVTTFVIFLDFFASAFVFFGGSANEKKNEDLEVKKSKFLKFSLRCRKPFFLQYHSFVINGFLCWCLSLSVNCGYNITVLKGGEDFVARSIGATILWYGHIILTDVLGTGSFFSFRDGVRSSRTAEVKLPFNYTVASFLKRGTLHRVDRSCIWLNLRGYTLYHSD